MSFNPAASYSQGLQIGQQQKLTGLKNALSGQMQEQGFNPAGSAEFKQLSALDPAYANTVLNSFTSLDESRQKAFFQDAQKGLQFLDSGDEQSFIQLANDRLADVERLGGDPSDIVDILQTYATGDIDGVKQKLGMAVNAGIQEGLLADPLDRQIKEAQLSKFQSREKPFKTAEQIERELQVSEGSLKLRRDELQQRQIADGKQKLSAKAEKAIIDSQDDYFASGENARKMELLANDFEKLDVGGGLSSSVSESFKDILGSQDEVTAARKRFNAIRSSQATSNLPPGPASDKDIALALSGFPKENANASQVLGFLRGQAKLARIDEKFNEFKADFISNNNSVRGLIPAWKNKLSEKEFLAEILTPKDALKEIQSPDTQAEQWARANPNDPRATAILKKLGKL